MARSADWWDGPFPPGKPREADGVRSRSRRGAFATTWWGRRFVDAMEAVGGPGRVARGRSYARSGQVLALDVAAGAVRAPVQGSRAAPYDVVLTFETWDGDARARVADALAADPGALAAVLAGTMPTGFEGLCTRAGLDLLPASGSDARFSCTCPDLGDPCKHAAAVVYLLAEWLDDHPFGVLTLRGVGRDALVADVSARRRGGSAAGTQVGAGAGPLERWDGPAAAFYAPLAPLPALGAAAPGPALRALDASHLGADATALLAALAPAYAVMGAASAPPDRASTVKGAPRAADPPPWPPTSATAPPPAAASA